MIRMASKNMDISTPFMSFSLRKWLNQKNTGITATMLTERTFDKMDSEPVKSSLIK